MEPICNICKKLDKEVLKNYEKEQDSLDEFLLEVKKDISEDLYVGDLLGVKNFKYLKLRENIKVLLEGFDWKYFDIKNFRGTNESGLFTIPKEQFQDLFKVLMDDEKVLKGNNKRLTNKSKHMSETILTLK